MKNMKKIILALFLLLFSLSIFSQTQTVIGTLNGKKVKVTYLKGSTSDHIYTLEYEALTDMEKKLTSLKTEKTQLEKQNLALDKKNKELDAIISGLKPGTKAEGGNPDSKNCDFLLDTIKSKNSEILILNKKINNILVNGCKELEKENEKLIKEKAELDAKIKNLDNQIVSLQSDIKSKESEITKKEQENSNLKKKLWNCEHPPSEKNCSSLAFSYSTSMPNMHNNLIDNSIWTQNNSLSNQFRLLFETPMSHTGNFSFGFGLGITNYKLSAHFSYFNETVNSQIDKDNNNYNAICSYTNVKENVSLLYFDIPIVLTYGQPKNSKISCYGKIGLTPSFALSNGFQGDGTYNISGYYPDWSVTLHNIPELNFNSNAACYDNANYTLNTFVLWGNISAGVYIPLSKESGKFLLKIGVKCDYSLTPLSKQLDESFVKGATYKIEQSNILSGSGNRIFSPGVEFSIIYKLMN